MPATYRLATTSCSVVFWSPLTASCWTLGSLLGCLNGYQKSLKRRSETDCESEALRSKKEKPHAPLSSGKRGGSSGQRSTTKGALCLREASALWRTVGEPIMSEKKNPGRSTMRLRGKSPQSKNGSFLETQYAANALKFASHPAFEEGSKTVRFHRTT